jgi:hypothetical protein
LVGKLADGKCWMLDNLKLGGTSTMSLTASDTNIVSNYTLPASGIRGFSSTTGGYYTAAINTASKNNTTTSYGEGSGKIGVYYNFCAASAETACAEKNSNDALYDVCPKGWRMPTGGSGGECETLYTVYDGDVSSFLSTLSIALAGYFLNYSAYYQGSEGNIWSSTHYGEGNAYCLFTEPSDVDSTYSLGRFFGYSMRCVAK